MSTKKEVAPIQSTSDQPLALAAQYEQEEGGGFENADREAFAIPFLLILQSMSPQCKKSEGAYIKGAEEGMFYNTVTNEVTAGDEGLIVIPCYYRRVFLKWAPRDTGGGFLGEFLPNDPIVSTVKRTEKGDVLPDGNLLVDTRVHYVLILRQDGTLQPAVMSLSSSQVKKSRQWMSKMDGIKFKDSTGRQYTPPMYSHTYKLSTIPEKNDQGSWFGWKIELNERQDDAQVFATAKEFKRQIAAGEAKEQVPASAPNEEDVTY